MAAPLWLKLLCIAAGGALGALARYGLSGVIAQRFTTPVPLGTLAVNVLGCLLIGLLAGVGAAQFGREEIKVGLLVGVLGAFTTFSTFGLETLRLVEDGQFAVAAANVLVSNVVGLAAVWAGARASQAWMGV